MADLNTAHKTQVDRRDDRVTGQQWLNDFERGKGGGTQRTIKGVLCEMLCL